MLPTAIVYGIDKNTFFHSTPKRLRTIYRLLEEKQDYEMWMMGRYVSQALLSTVCNGFIWRKKGQKPFEYPNTPFLHEKLKNEENTEPQELTEEEKKRRTENLFMQLRIMGANHNLSKKNNKGDTVS